MGRMACKRFTQHLKQGIAAFSFMAIVSLPAQEIGVCGNHASTHSEYYNAWYREAVRQVQMPDKAKRAVLKSDTVYRITVVFHLIYPVNASIDHSLIHTRLAELNADFMRRNKDTADLREIFRPRAGNPRIEFVLASATPEGLPSKGYTLTQSRKVYRFGVEPGTPFKYWHDMKFTDSGGINAWPTDRYLNIWVCNMISPQTFKTYVGGFATPPSGAPHWASQFYADSLSDGIVLSHETFQYPYRIGTLTHEVGHYLGLRHVSGDGPIGGIFTGNEPCFYDDQIFDTPKIRAQNSQCNKNTNTCVEDSADLPDMLENFMDYTAFCRNSFTKSQVALMRFCLRDLRPGLFAMDISKTYTAEHPALSVYPNPVQRTLHVDFKGSLPENCRLTLFDACGRAVLTVSLSATENTIEIPELPSGFYLCRISASDVLPEFRKLQVLL